MCVVTINKLNFRGVEKREELQRSDLTELLGWALLVLLLEWIQCVQATALSKYLSQNFLKFQTKKQIKLLARIIYYIMFPCVLLSSHTTKYYKNNTIIGINFVVFCRMA